MNFNTDSIFQVVQDSQVSVIDVILVTVLAACVGFFVSQVYRKTFKGISYSQSFAMALMLLPPITAIVMMTIGSNLARAFGLVGALSIIRFRTVIKDTKDIVMIFLALVSGIAIGTQNYHIGFLGTFLVLGLILLMHRVDYGTFSDKSYLLSFVIPQDKLKEKDYSDIIEQYSSSSTLLNISSYDSKKGEIEITYKLRDVSIPDRQRIMDALSKYEGVRNVSLVSTKNFIEY